MEMNKGNNLLTVKTSLLGYMVVGLTVYFIVITLLLIVFNNAIFIVLLNIPVLFILILYTIKKPSLIIFRSDGIELKNWFSIKLIPWERVLSMSIIEDSAFSYSNFKYYDIMTKNGKISIPFNKVNNEDFERMIEKYAVMEVYEKGSSVLFNLETLHFGTLKRWHKPGEHYIHTGLLDWLSDLNYNSWSNIKLIPIIGFLIVSLILLTVFIIGL